MNENQIECLIYSFIDDLIGVYIRDVEITGFLKLFGPGILCNLLPPDFLIEECLCSENPGIF